MHSCKTFILYSNTTLTASRIGDNINVTLYIYAIGFVYYAIVMLFH